MQSQGVQVVQELTSFIALLWMLGMASYLGSAFSLNPKINPRGDNPGEQAELLKKFMEFNPELQRGMIAYAEKIRKGYQKKGKARDLTKVE